MAKLSDATVAHAMDLLDDIGDQIKSAFLDGENVQGRTFEASKMTPDSGDIGSMTIILEPPSVIRQKAEDAQDFLDAYEDAKTEALGG